MLTVRVTKSSGHQVQVHMVRADTPTEESTVAGESEAKAPNPIAPSSSELYWSAGAFIVLLVAMRYYLFPKVKKGMELRYSSIRADIEGADAAVMGAQKDVAEYEKALQDVRAEAAARIDKARQTVDAERQSAIAEVNGRIATMRAESEAANAAARQAAKGQVEAAVTSVVTKAAELATGKTPDASTVSQVLSSVMEGAR